MKLLIVAELQEIKDFFDLIEKKLIQTFKHIQIYECNFCNTSFILTVCGVGKTNASFGLSFSLFNYKNINQIINIGTAGTLDNNLKIADAFLIENSKYWDVDLTALPNYKIGQLPDLPEKFNSDSKLNLIINKKLNLTFKNILSADSFLTKNNLKNIDIEEYSLVDMESTSLLHTAFLLNKEISIIKVISDYVLKSDNQNLYRENIKKCAIVITDILKTILIN